MGVPQGATAEESLGSENVQDIPSGGVFKWRMAEVGGGWLYCMGCHTTSGLETLGAPDLSGAEERGEEHLRSTSKCPIA